VENDATPKKMDGKLTFSDSDSSCESPVFPSSLGKEEGSDTGGAAPSMTPKLRVGESPTLHAKREIGNAEFARPFPVANTTPKGTVGKPCISDHDRQHEDSPVQLPANVTSDVTSNVVLCSAQAGVTDTGSVVESPEGSTCFEPKMHSTQIGGKSCHDDSFPSLRLDMSQQVGGDGVMSSLLCYHLCRVTSIVSSLSCHKHSFTSVMLSLLYVMSSSDMTQVR